MPPVVARSLRSERCATDLSEGFEKLAFARSVLSAAVCNRLCLAGIALSVWLCTLVLVTAADAQQTLPPMDLHIFMDRSKTVVSGSEDAPNRRLAERLQAVLALKVDDQNDRPLVSAQERLNFYTFGDGVTRIAENVSGTDEAAITAALKAFSEATFDDADKFTDLEALLDEIGRTGRSVPSDRFGIFLIASDLIHDPDNSSSDTSPGICYQVKLARADQGSMLDADMTALSGRGQQSELNDGTVASSTIAPNTFFVLLEIEPSEKSFQSATKRYAECASDLVRLRPIARGFESNFGAVTIKDSTFSEDSQEFAQLFLKKVFDATQRPLKLSEAEGRRVGQGFQLTLTVENPNRVSRRVSKLRVVHGATEDLITDIEIGPADGEIAAQSESKFVRTITREMGDILQRATSLKIAIVTPDGKVGGFIPFGRTDPSAPGIRQSPLSAELLAEQNQARMERPLLEDTASKIWEPRTIVLLDRETGQPIGREQQYPKDEAVPVLLTTPQTAVLRDNRLGATISMFNVRDNYALTTEPVEVQLKVFAPLEITDASTPSNGEVAVFVSNSNGQPLTVTGMRYFTDKEGEAEIGKTAAAPPGLEIAGGALDTEVTITLPKDVNKIIASRKVYVALVDHASGKNSNRLALPLEPTDHGDLVCHDIEMKAAADGTPEIKATVSKKVKSGRSASEILVLDSRNGNEILRKTIKSDTGQVMSDTPREIFVRLSADDYEILSNFPSVGVQVLDLNGKACEPTRVTNVIGPRVPYLVGQPKFLPLPDDVENGLDAVMFEIKLRRSEGLPAPIGKIRFMDKPGAVSYREVEIHPPVVIGGTSPITHNLRITTPLYKAISVMESLYFQYFVEQPGKPLLASEPLRIAGAAKRAMRVLDPAIESVRGTAQLSFNVIAQGGPLQLPDEVFLRVPGQQPIHLISMQLRNQTWLPTDKESDRITVPFGGDRQSDLFKSAVAPIEVCVLPQGARKNPDHCEVDWTAVSVEEPEPVIVRVKPTSEATGKAFTADLINPAAIAQEVVDVQLNPNDGQNAITKTLDVKRILIPGTAAEAVRLELTDDEANRLFAKETLSVSVGNGQNLTDAKEIPLEPVQAEIINVVANEIPTLFQSRYHIEGTFLVYRDFVPPGERMDTTFDVWLGDSSGALIPAVRRRLSHSVQLTDVDNARTFKVGWVLPKNRLPVDTSVYVTRQNISKTILDNGERNQIISTDAFSFLMFKIVLPGVLLILSLVSIYYYRKLRDSSVFSDLFSNVRIINYKFFEGVKVPTNFGALIAAIIMFILNFVENIDVVFKFFGINIVEFELDRIIFTVIILVVSFFIFPIIAALIYLGTVGRDISNYISEEDTNRIEIGGIGDVLNRNRAQLRKWCIIWSAIGLLTGAAVTGYWNNIYVSPGDVDIYYSVKALPPTVR